MTHFSVQHEWNRFKNSTVRYKFLSITYTTFDEVQVDLNKRFQISSQKNYCKSYMIIWYRILFKSRNQKRYFKHLLVVIKLIIYVKSQYVLILPYWKRDFTRRGFNRIEKWAIGNSFEHLCTYNFPIFSTNI